MIDKNRVFISKIKEYVDNSLNRENYIKYTDFLDEYEVSVAIGFLKNEYFTNYSFLHPVDSGYRNMLSIYSYGELPNFPVKFLKIAFNTPEYAEHRNILGALMNLNFTRDQVGEIRINDANAFVAVTDIAAEIIIRELDTVGKSKVTISRVNEFPGVDADFRKESYIISSERLDCIVSAVLKKGRNDAESIINNGLVFVNGVVIKNNAFKIKDNCKISIRGFGKFQIADMSERTGKGRIKLNILKFV